MSASRAGRRPRSLRIAGCRPRASSRSSSSPVSSSRIASSSSFAAHLRPRRQLRAREAQLQRDGHQALLRAVVQVALEPAALLVAHHHEPRARRDEILARLRAGDRERDQLAERAEAVLRVGRERLLAADRDGAPKRPGDDDRRRGGRPVAAVEHRLRRLAAEDAPVVDARGRLRPRTRPRLSAPRRPGCRRHGTRRSRRGCGGRRSSPSRRPRSARRRTR